MDVEFIRDDFGEIFFFHASNIWSRQNQLLTGRQAERAVGMGKTLKAHLLAMSNDPTKDSWVKKKQLKDAAQKQAKSSMGLLCQSKLEKNGSLNTFIKGIVDKEKEEPNQHKLSTIDYYKH